MVSRERQPDPLLRGSRQSRLASHPSKRDAPDDPAVFAIAALTERLLTPSAVAPEVVR